MRKRFRLLAAVCLLLVGTLPVAAQTYNLSPVAHQQFFDSSGNPLSGGKLYTCTAGSSCPGTPLATYSDSSGTSNANPVILDSGGWATVYLSTSAYKFVLKTSADVTVWTQDNVQVFNSLLGAALGGTGLNTSASNGVPSINAGTWQVNAITQNGVLYGGASNALSFTSAPSSNSVLTVSGGVPTWSATPQLTREGIGVAADAVYPLNIADGTANTRGINLAITSASGTNYGGYSSVTGAATTNYGYYATVSGASTNYSFYGAAGTFLNAGLNALGNLATANVQGNLTDNGILTVGTLSPNRLGILELVGNSSASGTIGELDFVHKNGGTYNAIVSVQGARNGADNTGKLIVATMNAGVSATRLTVDSSTITLGDGTLDVKWAKALVALGGGAAPTLGTIGGSGPATAGQNSWLRVIDSTGAAFWVPVWK